MFFIFPLGRRKEVADAALTWFRTRRWVVSGPINLVVFGANGGKVIAESSEHMDRYAWFASSPSGQEHFTFAPSGLLGDGKLTVPLKGECGFMLWVQSRPKTSAQGPSR